MKPDVFDPDQLGGKLREQSDYETEHACEDEFDSFITPETTCENKRFSFKKGDIISRKDAERRWWEEDMNYLFGNEYDGFWDCFKGFGSILQFLKDKLVNLKAVVYETLPYIETNDGFAIETTDSFESSLLVELDSFHKDFALFACFDPKSPNSLMWRGGEEALIFLGKYFIDKERSAIEGKFVFRLIDERITINTCNKSVVPESLEKYLV